MGKLGYTLQVFLKVSLLASIFFVSDVLTKLPYENMKKINNVNLLLPTIVDNNEYRSIQYSLQAFNGCYEWSSSQPNYLSVEGKPDLDNPRCNSISTVTLLSNKHYNNVIWITARDKETNDVLKVESRIASVARIEILTKLRTIDVGDIQVLEVLGYDSEGNVFSSLEGMRFEWTIQQNDQILEFVSVKDSAIKATELRKQLENSYYQTDIIVAKGLKTGQVTVNVRVNERDSFVREASVILYVIEHFILVPDNPIYVLPMSNFQYNLALVRTDNHHAHLQKIDLPNKNYLWTLKNDTIGKLHNTGLFQASLNLGHSDIIVNDTQTLDNSVYSAINVVAPFQMDLLIKEFDDKSWVKPHKIAFTQDEDDKFENIWFLIKGKKYYIRIHLYDVARNPIFITNNIKFKFALDKDLFNIVEVRNHEIVIQPLKKVNKVTIRASLERVEKWDLYTARTPIGVEKSLSVISQISLIKHETSIHLPFIRYPSVQGEALQQQIYQLHAVGGSGIYEWVSEDLAVAIVSQEGVVLPKMIGRTHIEVRDRRNGFNRDQIEIEISDLSYLKSIEEMKEVLVNSTDYLYIIAEGGSRVQRAFSNCTQLSFENADENKNLLVSQPAHTQYPDLLSEIYELESKNSIIKSILSSAISYSNLLVSMYEEYVSNNEISIGRLHSIFASYKTFGVCSKIKINSFFKGEVFTKIHFRENFANAPINSEEIKIKIYENYKIVEPELDPKIFPKTEVILSYGGSFTLSLEGGPNLWEETRKMHEIFTVLDGDDGQPLAQHLLQIGNAPKGHSQKPKKAYQINCGFPDKYARKVDYKHLLKISTWNHPDKKLPQPLNISSNLTISCKIPRSSQIYLWRANEAMHTVNTIKASGYEFINLKNNHHHYFQLFAFDADSKPFYDFSSMQVSWSVDRRYHASLGSIDFLEVCKNCEDQYTKLSLREYTGEIILRAEISKMKESFSKLQFDSFFDEITLKVMSDVELNPPKALMYYDPKNSLTVKILNGSGVFSVSTNDSSIIRFDYIRQLSQIVVYPLRMGYSKIIVKDLQLESSEEAVCQLAVLDAQVAVLSSDSNLIQEFNYTIMEVTVNDARGVSYDEEQYKYMTISLSIDSDSEYLKQSALRISNYEGRKNVFKVEGVITGYYRLIASVLNHRFSLEQPPHRIFSNSLDIHVFPKLKAKPSSILVAPDCTSTIELVGGPSEKSKIINNVEMNVLVSKEGVIQFIKQDNSIFYIKGLSTGFADIKIELKYKESHRIITSIVVEARVEMIDSIEILGMIDRKLYVGSVFRLIAMAKFKHTPFTPSICGAEYIWSSGPENVIQLSTNSHTKDFSSSKEKTENNDMNVAINATALQAGTGEISLRVKFNYPYPINSKIYSTNAKVRVIDILTTNIPSNFNLEPNSPSLLLMPPNTGYYLKTNKDNSKLRFSLSCGEKISGGISVSESGFVKTSNEKGKVTVIVEDQSVEKEIMMVNVLVANIYSLIVENSYKVLTLPLEGESNLRIFMQDFLGRLFSNEITGVEFGIYLTNPKIVDAKIIDQGSILSLRAKALGSALCTVFLVDNPGVFDTFYLSVGTIVTPSSPVYVHVGGTIQFSIASAGARKSSSIWSSDNKELVEVDASSGKAVSLKEGRVNVILSDMIQYYTKVNVIKVNKIIMDYSAPKKMTNIPTHYYYKEEYKIPFRFLADDKEIKHLSSEQGPIDNNLKFLCESSHPDWVKTSTLIVTDPKEDRQIVYCIISPRKRYPEEQIPQTVTIKTSIVSQRENLPRMTQDFNFEFLWAFKVKEEMVEMNKATNIKAIEISSANDLDIRADNDLLNKCIQSNYDQKRSIVSLNITIPSTKVFDRTIDSNLKIINPATNQIENIRVYYEPNLKISNKGSISSWFSFSKADYIVFCILIVILFIAILNTSKN